jgi:DNA transposition AAA+ family ATPase
MAPELLNSMDAAELRKLAQRIAEHQEAKKLSDNGLLKKFPAMGSTTTYKKILNDNLKELDLEKQLTNYRSVVALIESIQDEEEEEELFEDLVGPLELRRAFLETSTQRSNSRVIILEGDTGTGKTKCAQLLVKKLGMRFIWTEAADAWGDKPSAMLGAILKGLGEKILPMYTNDRLELAITRLESSRRALVIDEAHHLGPHCLNTVKTLVNRTPGEFILCAMRTLWNRLERDAYQEVKQLTGNRLSERIKLALRESDIKKLLDRRVQLNGDTKQAVGMLMQYAPARGNLAFVRQVCRKAREQADDGAVTIEIFTNAVTAEVNGR